MANNAFLHSAKRARNDEFYTQYVDIEKEMNAYLEYDQDVFRNKTILLPCDDPEWSNFTKYFAQNFERLGIKKLISTSYAFKSKGYGSEYIPTLFEAKDSKFDESLTEVCGKIFILDRDKSQDGRINIEDLDWRYLKGDGDYRSEEVTKLRDEADIVITNPPFSKFSNFLDWLIDGGVKFSIIGNLNALTYKETFPLLSSGKTWLGPSITSGDREFLIPPEIVDLQKFTGVIRKDAKGNDCYYQRVVGVRWYTNLDHGRRHQPLALMSMADNLKFSKHEAIRENGYRKYDNYDAIEVPFTDAIPSDYEGVMGVPISFMDKYCPEQFEIVGCSYDYGRPSFWPSNTNMNCSVNGKNVYKRFFIKSKGASK